MAKSVKQLSIFLENKAGSLNEILELLSEANIRIIASTLSDTTEYGILRIITEDVAAADKMLREQSKNSAMGDVIALECDAAAGSLHTILRQITGDGISVEYMYCFASKRRSVVIFKFSDTEAALSSIESHGIKTLGEGDLFEV